jgi:hypothetical protein
VSPAPVIAEWPRMSRSDGITVDEVTRLRCAIYTRRSTEEGLRIELPCAPKVIPHKDAAGRESLGPRTRTSSLPCPPVTCAVLLLGCMSHYCLTSSGADDTHCAAGPPATARCSKQAVWLLRVDRRVLIGQEIRRLELPTCAARPVGL